MPTAQELKRAREALDTQIAAVEQEEREAKVARLRAEEEARAAAEKAWREEEARVQEQAHLAAEARAREEEQHTGKEEERFAVERDLCKVEGATMTAILAIVGFCRKSGGGGEGGKSTQGQGERVSAGPRGGPRGGYRGCL